MQTNEQISIWIIQNEPRGAVRGFSKQKHFWELMCQRLTSSCAGAVNLILQRIPVLTWYFLTDFVSSQQPGKFHDWLRHIYLTDCFVSHNLMTNLKQHIVSHSAERLPPSLITYGTRGIWKHGDRRAGCGTWIEGTNKIKTLCCVLHPFTSYSATHVHIK